MIFSNIYCLNIIGELYTSCANTYTHYTQKEKPKIKINAKKEIRCEKCSENTHVQNKMDQGGI